MASSGRKRQYTDEYLIDALRRYGELLGETPSFERCARDYRHIEWLPSAPTYKDRFGSWNTAIKLAGMTPNESRHD